MRDTIFAAINTERRMQDNLHPAFPKELRMMILTKEVGEVANAFLEDKPMTELIGELLQVASVAIRWIEELESEMGRE